MTYGNRAIRRVQLAGLLIALTLLASCGKSTNTTPAGLPISITLLSNATSVAPGQTVTVTAAVYDQSSQGATWTLTPIDFGALTNQTPTSVTYTPPTTFTLPTQVTVTATSITNPNVTSSVQITATPLVVALSPLAAQTINQGEQILISPNVQNDTTNSGVTWALSPANGAGSLTNVGPSSATYLAPGIVSTPTLATVTATSITNPGVSASLEITVFASGGGQNVAALRVDGGPVPGQTYANGAFTSVTICNPGSTTACQTVDGILVDTGSYGLRILQSQIPLLKLPTLSNGNGNILENCAAAPDGSYLWGPVSQADIAIAGETAPSALVQVITSSNAPVPAGCSNGGTGNENSPQLLGANGILGVGTEPTDCTLVGVNYCDGSVQTIPPNLYYSCPTSGCAPTDSAITVPVDQQVQNPVPLFGQDSNGVVLQLPAVSGTESAVIGKLLFGIGTQLNNGLGSATVFTTNSSGNFTTFFHGQVLTDSFIDSGSNGLFFPDTMPLCTISTRFFCPASSVPYEPRNQGATQGSLITPLVVDNADTLFSVYPTNAAFSGLAGPNGVYNTCSNGSGACVFDWGFPFFYGRSVYSQIDGRNPPAGSPPGPWWAY